MMKKLLLYIIPLLIITAPVSAQNEKGSKAEVLAAEPADSTAVTDSAPMQSAEELPDKKLPSKGKDRKKDKKKKEDGKALEIEFTDTLTNEYLDSLKLSKDIKINDYTLIGFQYGAGLSQVIWNPSKAQRMMFVPVNVGITWTRYGKMFGYMPYFGVQAGLFYAREGFQLKKDKDKPGYNHLDGAEKEIIDVIEIPFMAHCHVDFWKMKVILNLGLYGGYRMKIKRFWLPETVRQPGDPGYYDYLDMVQWENRFKPTDNRFDFGIKGGVGFGFVFDPVEIHIEAMYKHSLSSLFQPDYASKYYYRYAYPSNIIISAGVHFQLTKRVGKTKAQLKRQAKLDAYGKNEDTDSKSRKSTDR